jgi:hypothetical protein
MEKLTEAVMNSKVFVDAVNDKLALQNYVDNEETFRTGVIRQILGMNVSLADSLTVDTGVYRSYFGSKGSLMYAMRPLKPSAVNNANVYNIGDMAQVEIYRTPATAGGQDLVSLRFGLACGVYGTAWDIANGGSNPDTAALELSTNWDKAATDDKLISIVEYKSK